MLGLGKDIPLATGNESEALLALVDGKFMTLPRPVSDGVLREGDRRPHRRSERWMERQGDLDHFATRAPFHMEGGKGTTSKIIKFQVRPDPLAK